MSFLAKLYINDRVINVLHSRISFHQEKDITNKPVGTIFGAQFTLIVELDATTDLLHQMMAVDRMVDGYVRFFKRDGMSKLYDYEFRDCFIAKYKVHFSSTNTEPTTLELLFSPGILRIGDAIHKKPWHITNLEAEAVEPTLEPDQNSKIIDYYITNLDNNRIEDAEIGDSIYLNIRTRNMIGKKININLSNPDEDYIYNGDRLKNDTITDFEIEKDDVKLELEVVAQEKKE